MTSKYEQVVKRLREESGRKLLAVSKLGISTNDKSCLEEDAAALLQRYHDALVRLGDEKLFLPLIKVSPGLGPQINWAKEYDARIDFANKALEEE